MPGQPAARVGDKIICALPNPVPPGPPMHTVPTGNPIMAPGWDSVQIDGAAAARITDKSICDGPSMAPVPNPILKGAFPVLIGKLPAARMTDMATHPGSFIAPPCCVKVLIGLAGTSGNPWEGKEECEKAKAGRSTPGSATQSYQNCGIEASRQIINRKNNSNVSEDQLLDDAMSRRVDGRRIAEKLPQRADSGGSLPKGQAALLTAHNVPAFTAPGMGAIQKAVAAGKGVIANVDCGTPGFYTEPPIPRPGSGHAIVVTGIEYDDNGDIANVITNDSGDDNGCGRPVPGPVFQQAHSTWGQEATITQQPIW